VCLVKYDAQDSQQFRQLRYVAITDLSIGIFRLRPLLGTIGLLRGDCFYQIRTERRQLWRIYGEQMLINLKAN
jgi:hypothetical protein